MKSLWDELSFLWKGLILIDVLLIVGKAVVGVLALTGNLP